VIHWWAPYVPIVEGAKGRIRSGPFAGSAATVLRVDGDSVRVAVDIFGRSTEITIRAEEISIDGAVRSPVSADCAFQLGDVVLVHGAFSMAKAGHEYVVRDVDEAKQRLFVSAVESSVEDDGDASVPFDDVTLVRPVRRDPLPDYVRALRRSAGKRGELKDLGLWAIRQLPQVDWDPFHWTLARDGALADEFAKLEEARWQEVLAELRRSEAALRARFEPLDDGARVALWQASWREWVDTTAAARARWTDEERVASNALDDVQRDAMLTLRERLERRRWNFSDPLWDQPADEPAVREDVAYDAWRTAHAMPSPEQVRGQCAAALAEAMERFAAVEVHVALVYGLRLPRHVAVARAFFDAAGGLRLADPRYPDLGELEILRFSQGLSEGYLLELFARDGLSRALRPGHDERLADRAYRDPPELVTVMRGDMDGLHWGLWYDDPRFLPAFLASSYANDDPVIGEGETTVLAEIHAQLSWRSDPKIDADTDENRTAQQASRFERRLLREYISALRQADRDAWAHDAASLCPDPRSEPLRGTPGIAAPAALQDPLPDVLTLARSEEPERDQVAELVAAADEALSRGRPVIALALARELHYRLERQADAGVTERLFDAAYRMLGRESLAEIARVHRAQRADANPADVFVEPDDG
jgi:hypothetical protein